ncbi:hypothetical protein T265_12056 [Opisthorchis viverrini]|uniref:Uncharacterized protein n=1 Tax=Opisthorchis viverrini TaxID=6198 RepID=A0A074Z0K9_OPIVI|nr:hypothetical protein T265_12056 [Opisthorchis viverrini]KER19007.1 hypothetical protein T265_12056 [Opisthorchis viverrini]
MIPPRRHKSPTDSFEDDSNSPASVPGWSFGVDVVRDEDIPSACPPDVSNSISAPMLMLDVWLSCGVVRDFAVTVDDLSGSTVVLSVVVFGCPVVEFCGSGSSQWSDGRLFGILLQSMCCAGGWGFGLCLVGSSVPDDVWLVGAGKAMDDLSTRLSVRIKFKRLHLFSSAASMASRLHQWICSGRCM